MHGWLIVHKYSTHICGFAEETTSECGRLLCITFAYSLYPTIQMHTVSSACRDKSEMSSFQKLEKKFMNRQIYATHPSLECPSRCHNFTEREPENTMHVIISGSCTNDRRNRLRHFQVPHIHSIQCSVPFFVLLLPSPEAILRSDQSTAIA